GPTSRNAARDRIRIQSYRNTLPASIEFSVVLRRTLRRSRVERSVSTLLGQVTQASARAPTRRTPPRRFRAAREHDLVLPAKVRTRGALTPRVRVNSSPSRQQSGKRDAADRRGERLSEGSARYRGGLQCPGDGERASGRRERDIESVQSHFDGRDHD